MKALPRRGAIEFRQSLCGVRPLRRLFVHIGTHKSGTTSLQAYLGDARAALREAGTQVVTEIHRNRQESANCLNFAHGILRNGLRTVARMAGGTHSSTSLRGLLYRAHVREQLKALPAGASAVLSTEALCFARTGREARRLARVFGGLGLEVIPVVCFRDDAGWRESWQAELRAASGAMARDHGEGINDIRGDWVFDREAIRSFWEEIGPVREVSFDDSVARDGSVLPAVLSALETPVIGDLDAYRLRRRKAAI